MIAGLREEGERIDRAVTALLRIQSLTRTRGGKTSAPAPSRGKKKRRLSAAARRRLSEAMKKRWAERKRKGLKRLG